MMKIVKRLAFVLDLIAAVMFASLFVAIVAQTTMRYVFDSPLSMTLEFATLAFIWMTFWAASLCLPINGHIRFEVVSNLLHDQVRRAFGVLTNLFFTAVFVFAVWEIWGYFQFLETQHTGSLGITDQQAFAPYFVFFLVLPVRMAIHVVGLFLPGWRERV